MNQQSAESLKRSGRSNPQTSHTHRAITMVARLADGIKSTVHTGLMVPTIWVLRGIGVTAMILTAPLWLSGLILLGTDGYTRRHITKLQQKKNLHSCTTKAAKTMPDGRPGPELNIGGKLTGSCNDPVLYDWYTFKDMEMLDDQLKLIEPDKVKRAKMIVLFDEEFGS